MMNKNFTLKWIEEMESGKWRQCRKYLGKWDMRDPFGVACEMLKLQKFQNQSTGVMHFGTSADIYQPPQEVLEAFGLNRQARIDADFYSQVQNLNDNKKMSFRDISLNVRLLAKL